MKHAAHFVISLLSIAYLAGPAQAEIVVVVHPDSPIQSLSAKDIADLYLGRSRTLGSREHAVVLDHPRDSKLRSDFFSLLNGMDLRRVNAYWARLQFSGDTQPPVSLPDNQTIINTVRLNRQAIGYVDASALTPEVKPVLRLKP